MARGWLRLGRCRVKTCHAEPGEPCRAENGVESILVHAVRYAPAPRSRFSAPPPVNAPPVKAGQAWLWPDGTPVRVACTCPCGVTIEAYSDRDMALALQQHRESDEHL